MRAPPVVVVIGLALLLCACPPTINDRSDGGAGPGSDATQVSSDSGSAGEVDAGALPDASAIAGADAGPPADIGPVPGWRQGMAKWSWKEIPGTSLSQTTVPDPFSGSAVAPNGRVDAWNGLAANRDTDRLYLACAGGHADWAGNEVYELDLRSESPAWKVLRGPTMAPDVLASDSSKGVFHHYYADGRPSSTHLYYALQFVRARGRVFKLCAGSLWGTGNEANNKVDAFDLAKGDWDPEGTFAETPGGSPPSATTDGAIIGRAFAQHPDTEDVYTQFSGKFWRWTQASATWTPLAARPAYANDDILQQSPAAVDPKRGRVLFTRNAYKAAEHQGLVYDLAADSVADAVFTGSAAAEATGGSLGLVYLPGEDAFLLKLGTAGAVVRIDPETFEAARLSTSGAEPPDAVNGVYTRWLHLPRLKGVAYLPRASANVWFLATE